MPTLDELIKIRSIVANAFKNVFDPDMGVSIYDLGLLYDIDVSQVTHDYYDDFVKNFKTKTVQNQNFEQIAEQAQIGETEENIAQNSGVLTRESNESAQEVNLGQLPIEDSPDTSLVAAFDIVENKLSAFSDNNDASVSEVTITNLENKEIIAGNDNVTFILIKMTLTSPACPVGDMIVSDVRESINNSKLPIGAKVAILLVWEPLWSWDMAIVNELMWAFV